MSSNFFCRLNENYSIRTQQTAFPADVSVEHKPNILYMSRLTKFWYLSHMRKINRHARIQRGGGGARKNHKTIVVLCNTCTYPLENHKATKPAFNFDHLPYTSETQFKWRFAGVPIMIRLWWYLDPTSPSKTK